MKIINYLYILLIIVTPYLYSQIREPDWITKEPEIKGFIVGVGGPAKSFEEAYQISFIEISKKIGIEIKNIISNNNKIKEAIEIGFINQKELEKDLKDEYIEACKSNAIYDEFGVKIQEKYQNRITNKFYCLSALSKDILTKKMEEKIVFLNTLNKKIQEIYDSSSSLQSLLIGNFVIKDKNISSEFSSFLEKIIISIITNNNYFKIYDKNKLLKDLNKNKVNTSNIVSTRGISVDKKKEQQQTVNMNIEPNGIISGEYWPKSNSVTFFIYLIDTKTSQLLETKSFDIPLDKLPKGLSMEPENYKETVRVIEETNTIPVNNNSDLNIKVWTDRGDGAVYELDEKMIINVKANKDCYIKIFYITAAGELFMIFPNSYDSNNFIKGNTVYSFGDENYAFDFKLVPPLGTEIIKVIASKNQFSDIKSYDYSDVVVSMGKTRGIDVAGKMKQGLNQGTADAIAQCLYTVIDKKNR